MNDAPIFPCSVETLQEALAARVMDAVTDRYGYKAEIITGTSRNGKVVFARSVAMIAMHLLGFGVQAIAEAASRRRDSVLHCMAKIKHSAGLGATLRSEAEIIRRAAFTMNTISPCKK